jgi:hypothetical protein
VFISRLLRLLLANADPSCASPETRLSRLRNGYDTEAQGHPHTIFRRALERENLPVAKATAKEIDVSASTRMLELTLLIARKDPRRHPRVAARWLLRYLE